MRVERAHVEELLARRATRRGVLAGGLSAAAASIAVSRPGQPTRGFAHVRTATPAATPALGGTPFTLGVASGDPLPDSVVLWTRLATDPVHGVR